jgi:hypothetical protein
VVSGLEKIDSAFIHAVYQPMFLRHPSRPAPRQHILEWFWFAYPGERVSQHRLDQFKYSQGDLSVCIDPATQILAKLGMEYRIALTDSSQVPSPGAAFREAQACPSVLQHAAMQ